MFLSESKLTVSLVIIPSIAVKYAAASTVAGAAAVSPVATAVQQLTENGTLASLPRAPQVHSATHSPVPATTAPVAPD